MAEDDDHGPFNEGSWEKSLELKFYGNLRFTPMVLVMFPNFSKGMYIIADCGVRS